MKTVFSHLAVRRPYPGLRPFEPHEAEIFFGREAHVDRLLEILQQRRFLAVIGPSGCGKSSLVRAGLLPAVAAGWLGTGSDWRIAVLRPGDRPLRELARTLGAAEVLGGDAVTIETELARGRRGLIDVFDCAALRSNDKQHLNLLVLVDQFEELFTYARSGVAQADESGDFVNLLLAAATERDSRIHVVMTMRTDFLGNCVRFLDLPDAVNRGMFLTPRLNRDEMRTAITGPATLFGGSVDDRLAGQLINGVGGDSDELPILQHALSQVWEKAAARSSTTMLPEDLEKIGGLDHALSAHADAVYDRLPRALQPLATKLFQFITERTTEENGSRDVRRPRSLREIAAAIPHCDWTTLVPIVEAFAAEGVNFVTFGRSLGPDSIIDISHEALIRKWDRLQQWVAEEAGRAGGYRRWREWAATGTVIPPVELLLAVRWRDGGEDGVPPDVHWASRYGTAEHFQATLAHITASRNEERRRRRAKQWWRASAALGVVVLAVAFFGFKVREFRVEQARALVELDAKKAKQDAERLQDQLQAAEAKRLSDQRFAEAQAKEAEAQAKEKELAFLKAQQEAGLARTATADAQARRLVSESHVYAPDDPERAQLLAIEAYRAHSSPDTESMLREVRMRYASLLHTIRGPGEARRVSLSPDGKTLLVIGKDSEASLWNAGTGSKPTELGAAVDGAYTPDGTRIVTTGSGKVRIRDASGKVVAELPGGVASVNPKGRSFAIAGAGNTATIREVASPDKVVAVLTGHTSSVIDLAYSLDGKTIATAGTDDTVRLWDAADGRPLLPPLPLSARARQIVLSNDGKRLLTLHFPWGGQVWDTTTGTATATLAANASITDAAFSTNGTVVVTADTDGGVRSWNADTGELIQTIGSYGQDSPAHAVAFPPDRNTVLIAGGDGTAQLFDPEEGGPIATFDANDGPVVSAAFSADGKTIVTAHDHAVRLWDARAGRPRMEFAAAPIPEGEDPEFAAAFLRNDKLITVGSETRLWDIGSWTSRVIPGKEKTDAPMLLSADGARILTLAKDEMTLVVLDSVTGRRLATLDMAALKTPSDPEDEAAMELGLTIALGEAVLFSALDMPFLLGLKDAEEHLEFSANAQHVTLFTPTHAYVWETRHGKLLAKLEGDFALAWMSPDGKWIAANSTERLPALWSVDGKRLLHAKIGDPSEQSALALAFSPDGTILATADFEGGLFGSRGTTVRLWDTRSGRLLRRLPHEGVMHAVFSPDGDTILTTSPDARMLLWNVRTGRSITLAAPLRAQRGAKKAQQAAEKSTMFIAFSPDGQTVATAFDDGAIRVWDTRTGRQLALLEGNVGMAPLSYSPDGRFLVATAYDDGTVRVWDVSGLRESVQQVIAAIEQRVGRSLSDEERQQSNLPARKRAVQSARAN